jgi:alpha-amylase
MAIALVTLGACAKKETAAVKKVPAGHGNYYEIFVGSFYDSNGDGMGDLRGVIQKLDYLNPRSLLEYPSAVAFVRPVMDA